MWQYLLLSALLLWTPGMGAVFVEQPPFLTGTRKNPESLQCTLKQTNCNWMYWYRQRKGRELEGLFSSLQDGPGTNFTSEPMTAHRASTKWDLKWNNLSQSDSAVYYCACSTASTGTNDKVYFGTGTKLTVIEDGLKITAPTVAIFPPSKQEINDKKKATLVCLATDFYPDHIKLVWKVNGEERKEGVKTEESVRDESSKRYSLTSRLRVSSQEWFNSKIVFKCSVDFYTNMTQIYAKEIRGGTDCSVSEESYLRSAIAGKSVYILLIFKSALYGFFVMGLVLRNKQVH